MSLIDADIFMNELNESQQEFDEYYKGLGKAKALLLSQPAVNAEPVKYGHWVTPTVINGRGFNVPHCSVCNEVPCGVDEHTKYCPNCGAKMY